MNAKLVNENLNFKRGLNSKYSLDIGLKMQIKNWMEDVLQLDSQSYEINSDYTINISIGFNFVNRPEIFGQSRKFPPFIKFKYASEYFDIDDCRLFSLRGCPDIVNGYFSCQMNPIKNLIGGPKIIKDDCYLNSTNLISLVGLATEIGGNLDISNIPGKMNEKEAREISQIRGKVIKDMINF